MIKEIIENLYSFGNLLFFIEDYIWKFLLFFKLKKKLKYKCIPNSIYGFKKINYN
jgi:hypothetical protein